MVNTDHYNILLGSVTTAVGLGPYCVVRFDEEDCVPSYHGSYHLARMEMENLKQEGIRSAMYTVERLSDGS